MSRSSDVPEETIVAGDVTERTVMQDSMAFHFVEAGQAIVSSSLMAAGHMLPTCRSL